MTRRSPLVLALLVLALAASDAAATPYRPFTPVMPVTLVASDAAAGDNFGASVAVSGTTILVGAYQHTARFVRGVGAAYVFSAAGAGYAQQAELVAADGALNDYFGQAVAVDGGIAVVGAPGRGRGQGAVYVFVASLGHWTPQATLVASDGAAGDAFGSAVAVRGGVVLVGAPAKAVGGHPFQGAVYTFEAAGTAWTQRAKLVASDGGERDRFGSAVALDGGVIVVGAPMRSAKPVVNGGGAYVFAANAGGWTEEARLTPSDPVRDAGFGASVAVSGTTALVGAQDQGTGAAYAFSRRGASVAGGIAWSQDAKLVAADAAPADNFGSSVALRGPLAVVGARSKDDTGGAYVFGRAASAWTPSIGLAPAQRDAHDSVGESVALDGTVAVVGSNHGTGGAVYVFRVDGVASAAHP